jgi:hypothetical protein
MRRETMTHTKGPWKVDGANAQWGDGTKVRAIWGNEGEGMGAVAWVTDDYFEELEANARLIAAAPELLEACKLTAAIVTDKYDARNVSLEAAWDAATEAIAKAQGDD